MGLDITAYRGIEAVRKQRNDDDDGYEDGMARFWIMPEFKAAADDVKEKTLYRYAEAFGFRAGSYIGYNRWREWLAGLVGTTPERVWNGEKAKAFQELINFADNEGTIGPRTAAKLAKDFAEYDEHAKRVSPDGYDYYDRYKNWRKGFEMAAQNGAVSFH